MLLPETETLQAKQIAENGEQSWRIDWNQQRVGGRISGLEALTQRIGLRLRTRQGEHLIYSAAYGLNRQELEQGQTQAVSRRIEECLAEEEQVIGIRDFSCTADGDTADIRFTVCTVLGDAEIILQEGI